MDKCEQKSTQLTQVTGLTPAQEQAALLLASGESVTDVAEKVNVTRATIYACQQKITFICFFNQQCQMIKDSIRNGLCGLYANAIDAVKGCLESVNEATRLKAAMYVIGKVELMDTSKQNPEEEIKKLCTSSDLDWGDFTSLDKTKYKEMMKEYGLM